jgi:transcriptional regulator with XRE-family HTH domain
MERKEYRSTRARSVGQRIGPALRALRRREGLTIDDLAARCGLSRACISRIERGQQDVTLPGLMSLSTALGVDVTYFASYQDASSQTECELREILAEVGIASQTIPSLLSLSFEAQGALLDGLRWLTLAHRSRPLRTKELVDQIVTHGVEASIAHILSAIAEFGLDVGGFCRAITQMEELSGDRMVMSDRLLSVTTPTDPHVDAIDIFRSIFQREPEDTTLIRWWAQALRSAVRENVSRFKTRTIYPLSAIRKYIDSGYWGVGVAVDPDLVRRHISDLVKTLRENPNVKIGILEEQLPFNLLIKGEKQAMAYVRLGSDIFPGQGPGVAFRSARTDVVHKFREYFDGLWEDIPPEYKDSEAVVAWLETQLAAIPS